MATTKAKFKDKKQPLALQLVGTDTANLDAPVSPVH